MKKKIENHFDLISIILHWVMALALFFLFGLGLFMVELTYYDTWYKGAFELHKSIGMLVFALLFFRIIWRATALWSQTKNLKRIASENIEEALAILMHFSLYVLMFGICLTGYLISTAGGRSIDVFSLISLGAIPFEIVNQEDLAGLWHYYLAWCMILFASCHTLAALKHHFIDKDNVLKNMLKPNKKGVIE